MAAADSYTDGTAAAANFGTATNVFADTSPAQRGYLRFVASGITGTVQSAVVRVWVTDSTSNAPQIATTSSAWTETGLTWTNQPAPGTVTGDLGSVSKNTFIDYPVTVAVNGDGTYSFVLVAQSSNGLGVASREATATNRPRLVVTFLPSTSGDTEDPSVPTGVSAVAASSSLVNVSWTASTDNVGGDRLRRPARRRRHRVGVRHHPDLPRRDGRRVDDVQLHGRGQGPRRQPVRSERRVQSSPRRPRAARPRSASWLSRTATPTATAAAANFGTATNVFADTSPAQRGYLRFVASGITGTVQSAVVRVWVTDSTSNAPQIATTSSAWTETGLTWTNQPAPGTVTGDLGSVSKNTFIDYPVTVAVNGDGTYSFVLVAQSSNGLGVASREATATNRPRLVVTFD